MNGIIFFIYLILNGLERFIIETIRVNPRYHALGTELSQAQIIAVGLMVIGVLGILGVWNYNRKKASY